MHDGQAFSGTRIFLHDVCHLNSMTRAFLLSLDLAASSECCLRVGAPPSCASCFCCGLSLLSTHLRSLARSFARSMTHTVTPLRARNQIIPAGAMTVGSRGQVVPVVFSNRILPRHITALGTRRHRPPAVMMCLTEAMRVIVSRSILPVC